MVSESDSDVGNPGSVRLVPWFKHSVPDPAWAPSDSDSRPGPRPPRALVQGPHSESVPGTQLQAGPAVPGPPAPGHPTVSGHWPGYGMPGRTRTRRSVPGNEVTVLWTPGRRRTRTQCQLRLTGPIMMIQISSSLSVQHRDSDWQLV